MCVCTVMRQGGAGREIEGGGGAVNIISNGVVIVVDDNLNTSRGWW